MLRHNEKESKEGVIKKKKGKYEVRKERKEGRKEERRKERKKERITSHELSLAEKRQFHMLR